MQYVVTDPATQLCAIIDPVLDYDEKSGSTATNSADAILDYVRTNGLTVAWILDTHPHADHFSAATYLKKITGAPTGIGDHVVEVQRLWKPLCNLPESFPTDGSQWDHRFADGESFRLGEIEGKVLFSPGHTLASITYVFGDAAFIHDTLFMPDSGTRAPIFRVAVRMRFGAASRTFSLCRTTRASIPDMIFSPAAVRGIADQHHRRAAAGGGEQWTPLSQNTARCPGEFRLGLSEANVSLGVGRVLHGNGGQ